MPILFYIIMALTVALAGTGYALVGQIQDNGAQKIILKQQEDAIGTWIDKYDESEGALKVSQESTIAALREKAAIQNDVKRITKAVEGLSKNDDETKDWVSRCDVLPAALDLCMWSGQCGDEGGNQGAEAVAPAPAAHGSP